MTHNLNDLVYRITPKERAVNTPPSAGRDYAHLFVLDYTIKNIGDFVTLGKLNPHYNPHNNGSEPLIKEVVDAEEIFREVQSLASVRGTQDPDTQAGQKFIELMGRVREQKYSATRRE